jgi:hypothetical protein
VDAGYVAAAEATGRKPVRPAPTNSSTVALISSCAVTGSTWWCNASTGWQNRCRTTRFTRRQKCHCADHRSMLRHQHRLPREARRRRVKTQPQQEKPRPQGYLPRPRGYLSRPRPSELARKAKRLATARQITSTAKLRGSRAEQKASRSASLACTDRSEPCAGEAFCLAREAIWSAVGTLDVAGGSREGSHRSVPISDGPIMRRGQ